jgi:hypothetical protein
MLLKIQIVKIKLSGINVKYGRKLNVELGSN